LNGADGDDGVDGRSVMWSRRVKLKTTWTSRDRTPQRYANPGPVYPGIYLRRSTSATRREPTPS
jgi:hypothetical protein